MAGARWRRPVLAAVAVAVVLGGVGFAIAEMLDNGGSTQALSLEPTSSQAASTVISTTAPATATTGLPEPATPAEIREPAADMAPNAQASEPGEPPPAESAPQPAKVGAPYANGLFPGESPPPMPGSGAARQWWDNHWGLKDRWLNGG